MTKSMLASAAVIFISAALHSPTAEAQCTSCGGESIDSVVTGDSYVTESDCSSGNCGSARGCLSCLGNVDSSVRDEDGMIQPTTHRHLHLKEALKYGIQDHFSPNPYFAYSNAGMGAGHTHAWNKQQATANPWHGGYSHWKWGTPTALVVPANASYGSNYAWGVGQTTSTPLYHQFGRGNAGVVFGSGQGVFPNAPYWPASTNQYGVYPVRAPW